MTPMNYVLLIISFASVSGWKYDYAEVLHKSILFYDAQRSGRLPADFRVIWRKDSALTDGAAEGHDLSGGWYDGGDHLKFGFPMAWTTTVLLWGLLSYRHAYETVGEYKNMIESVKVPLNYIMKCHTSDYEYFAQVGDVELDHSFWGRPEDMTMSRPAHALNITHPGTDLLAEAAAALAAGFLVFTEFDAKYATQLLDHAEKLYNFANMYQGKYSDVMPANAQSFYKSSGYQDELVWGAIWLYKATSDIRYLRSAVAGYTRTDKLQSFHWDNKTLGSLILLYSLTKNDTYRSDLRGCLTKWLPGNQASYTPKGLAMMKGTTGLKHSANVAFLSLLASDAGIMPGRLRAWARGQIHYILGDGGQSFVVGFGKNPPQRPTHRAGSCPFKPKPCDWSNYFTSNPNPHTLEGAVVNGPDAYDGYVDKRMDSSRNGVCCDANAGFQSAVAGLIQLDRLESPPKPGYVFKHHKFPKKKASAGVSRTKVGTTFLRRKSHKRDPNDIFRPAIIPPDEDGERPVPIFFPKTTRNHPTRSPNKIETTKTHYQRTASNRATTSSIPTTRKIKKMIGCREGRHKDNPTSLSHHIPLTMRLWFGDSARDVLGKCSGEGFCQAYVCLYRRIPPSLRDDLLRHGLEFIYLKLGTHTGCGIHRLERSVLLKLLKFSRENGYKFI